MSSTLLSLMKVCALSSLVLVASPSGACRTSAQMRSYLFNSDPGSSAGAFAAKVQIIQNLSTADHPFFRARVLAALRGASRGRTIRIIPDAHSNCDVLPRPGEVGIVAGRIVGSSDGELSISPTAAALRPLG